MSQRWVRAPEGSHWGEFGADDQRGRMKLVTPEKVLQGRGVRVDLAHHLGRRRPAAELMAPKLQRPQPTRQPRLPLRLPGAVSSPVTPIATV